MKQFKITWVIDLDADTALDAASIAREIQMDPESLANCFDVTDRETGQVVNVDLLDMVETVYPNRSA